MPGVTVSVCGSGRSRGCGRRFLRLRGTALRCVPCSNARKARLARGAEEGWTLLGPGWVAKEAPPAYWWQRY